jgi:hypothetical protein
MGTCACGCSLWSWACWHKQLGAALTKQHTSTLGDVAKALPSLNNSEAPQENLVLAAFSTLVSLHVGCKAERQQSSYFIQAHDAGGWQACVLCGPMVFHIVLACVKMLSNCCKSTA